MSRTIRGWMPIVLALSGAALVALAALVLPGGDAFRGPRSVDAATSGDDDENGVTEREIALADVPEAARAAIELEAGENPILEVEAITGVDGVVLYEAEWRIAGREIEVVVTALGEVIGREVEAPDAGEDD